MRVVEEGCRRCEVWQMNSWQKEGKLGKVFKKRQMYEKREMYDKRDIWETINLK